MKSKSVVRIFLFDQVTSARSALERLTEHGARVIDLGVITHDPAGHPVVDTSVAQHDEALDPIQSETFSERAARNGARGAVVGGLVGMLGGLAALLIPGAGPVLLLGSVAGLVTGGVFTALSTHMVDEPEAIVFAEALRRGGTLLFVHDAATGIAGLDTLMTHSGAVDLPRRVAAWRSGGWTGYVPPPEPPAEPKMLPEGPEPKVQPDDHFQFEAPQAESAWVAGHWAELVGPLQALWPKLTAADLQAIDGHRGRLVHRVRELYGDSQGRVDWQLDELLARTLGAPALQDSPSAHNSCSQEGIPW